MTVKVQQFQALTRAIEFAAESHRVTGQNLANISTPGYRAKEIPFEALLENLDKPKSTGNFEVQESAGLATRADGNNVDLDRELSALKKNAMAFQTLAQLLASQMGILKQAING